MMMEGHRNAEQQALVSTNESEAAVCVLNASKSFSFMNSKLHVIRNLWMTVPQSAIYSLLGASGCGKSTLLSCILGLQKLDAGSVSICGEADRGLRGGKIGYMPQEQALYPFFTIRETHYFFSQIHGMSKAELKRSTAFLCELLDLPNDDRQIGKLSGGQQRRVSLSVALLHNPEMLILDEPTVGIDCVLRDRIWEYMREIVMNGKTILITTHYIEEARQSHKVGYMYDGRLLVEDEPVSLLNKYGLDSLEDVFLNLCQANKGIEASSTSLKSSVRNVGSSTSLKKTGRLKRLLVNCPRKRGSLTGFRAMLWKNYSVLLRNYLELAFYIFIPLGDLIMAGIAFGNAPVAVPLGIVNNEFQNDPFCQPHDRCALVDFSCNLLNAMDQDMAHFKPYVDHETAVEAIQSGDIRGVLSIPPNFTDHMYSRLFKGVKADQESLNGSQILLTLDRTDYHVAFYLEYMVYTSFNTFAKDILTNCRLQPQAASLPVVLDEPIYGERKPEFREYLLPAVLSVSVSFLVMLFSSTTQINEKNCGLLDRLWVSGLNGRTHVLSSVLMQICLMIFLFVLTMSVAVFGFGLVVRGNFFWVILLLLLQGFCAMAFGNLLAVLLSDSALTVQVIIGFMVITLIAGDVVWPVQSMSLNIRWLSQSLPYTMSVDSLRSILIRGWTPWHKSVWPGFAATFAWTVFFSLLIMYCANKKKGSGR